MKIYILEWSDEEDYLYRRFVTNKGDIAKVERKAWEHDGAENVSVKQVNFPWRNKKALVEFLNEHCGY